jgi:hypothetical protein
MRDRSNVVNPRAGPVIHYGHNLAHKLLSFDTPRLRYPHLLRREKHRVLLQGSVHTLSTAHRYSVSNAGIAVVSDELLRLPLIEPDHLDRGLVIAMSAGRSTHAPIEISKTGEVSEQARDLLCALSYVHLAFGQSIHYLALLRLAAHADSQDNLLCVLAYALISRSRRRSTNDPGGPEILDEQPSSRLRLTLMRSHALRLAWPAGCKWRARFSRAMSPAWQRSSYEQS